MSRMFVYGLQTNTAEAGLCVPTALINALNSQRHIFQIRVRTC